MTVDRDLDLAVGAWLAPGVDRLPAHLRHDILAEIAHVPQGIRPSARVVVHRPPPVGLAVAAVVTVATIAVAGGFLLRGPQSGVGTPSATPSPSAIATPPPSAAATAIFPGRVPVEGNPVTTFLADIPEPPTASPGPTAPSTPIGTDGPVAPGRYQIPQVAGTVVGYKTFEMTVPSGWMLDGRRIVKHAGGDDEVALGWWVVGNVYQDPCHWTTSPVSPIDLAGHAHPDGGFTITEPPDAGLRGQLDRAPSPLRLTFVGGVLTLHIELEVPAGLGITDCDQGRYVRWSDLGSDGAVDDRARPGQVDAVYEVDVDRKPLTIDVSHGPAASSADLAEVQAILDSIVIDR